MAMRDIVADCLVKSHPWGGKGESEGGDKKF